MVPENTIRTINKPLFLASASPRRQELLQQMGLEFEVAIAPVEEVALPHESPSSYVLRIAIEKALAGFNKVAGKQIWVLGGDTAVVLDGKVFGKPKNQFDAVRMLSALSGKTHQVLSAIALVYDGEVFSALNTSQVSFTELTQQEISRYVETEEPMGKAGAYAIQGQAAGFVKELHGSYSAVMGLPLYELRELLLESGYFQRPAN